MQSERPGRQKEKEKKKRKERERWRKDEKVLEERITLPSGTDTEGGEVDLWLRVSSVFFLSPLLNGRIEERLEFRGPLTHTQACRLRG